MLHTLSELMFASMLATGTLAAIPPDAAAPAAAAVEPPAPLVAVLEALPDIPSPTLAAPEALPDMPASALAVPGADADSATLGRSIPAERLGAARGGSGIASDTRLGGEVAGNTAHGIVTGANRIDTGSFSGSVGLPVVIQNSGANVLIQNATVINLQFK